MKNLVILLRPKALEVLHHPLFWNSETRLSFLRDTSDRVELEDRQTGSGLLQALESIATTAFDAKWNEKMERSFIADISLYRRYKYDSVRDLLRVMRNKLNHYRELPKGIQVKHRLSHTRHAYLTLDSSGLAHLIPIFTCCGCYCRNL